MGRIFRHSLIHFVEGTGEEEEKWGKEDHISLHRKRSARKGDNKAACLRCVFPVHYSFGIADRPIYNSNQLPDEDLGTTREGKKGPMSCLIFSVTSAM